MDAQQDAHENTPESLALRTQIGRNVRRIRRKRGMKQETLAAECGYAQASISLIERGLMWPSVPQLVCLARVLGVTVNDLLRT